MKKIKKILDAFEENQKENKTKKKTKIKEFILTLSLTFLNYTFLGITMTNMDNGVEIIKPATVLKYECDHCGCVFRIKQYLCDWTELYPKIFDYTAKCPECKRVCTNYDDEV